MTDVFTELNNEFQRNCREKGYQYPVNVVNNFCDTNSLSGIDGLPGLLNYATKLIEIKKITSGDNRAILLSFCEIAYTIWALEKLGKSSFAHRVAKSLETGGDFGDTSSYMGDAVNYFRSYELEFTAGLRLLEGGLNPVPGGAGEPDYLFSSPEWVLEVKVPSSLLGLFQRLIKAVKQIEKSEKPGVILVALDHLAKRGIIPTKQRFLPQNIENIIYSALPSTLNSYTAGVVAEWVDWNTGMCTVQPLMLSTNSNRIDLELVQIIQRCLLAPNEALRSPSRGNGSHPVPYDTLGFSSINPEIDGKRLYLKAWGTL